MFHRLCVFLLVAGGLVTLPLWAQQPCPGYSVAVGTPEDTLVLAYNGADSPKEQLDALLKFEQEHADSKFMPCANEYSASVELKLNDFDKSIEYAEKDLAANYHDLYLYQNLLRAYASSAKVSDTIFDVINKVPDQAKVEAGNPLRPSKATDEEWEKIKSDSAEVIKTSHDLAIWAFFQVLPRVTDPAKRTQVLDTFLKTYPEAEKDNAAQVNFTYFVAYQAQGNVEKTLQYGDKIVDADPNNIEVLTAMGSITAFYLSQPAPDKAGGYAQKAVTAAPNVKKPEGIDDAVFKKTMDGQLGMDHLILGYANLMKNKLAPAINELKLSVPLLEGNPAFQGRALYYLAFAYEKSYPANHRAALDALNKGVTLPGPFQGQSQALLAKVKAALQ
jgi:tetratricopeptide (TPR) repeat protein